VGVGSRYLVAALLITLILWNIPYGWVALYPFKIFATWIHESAHGLVMLITGAGIDRVEIFRDTSGLAYPRHGVTAVAQAAISSAGYMGTSLFGAMFLLLGRTERGGRMVLGALGVAMGLSAALTVRNGFGIVAVAVGGAVLLVLSRFGGERLCGFLTNFLAAQSCINSVLDIRVLFGATMYVDGQPHAHSDADAVAQVLGGPAWMWASLWLAWSFALFYFVLRILRPPEPATLPLPLPGDAGNPM
jgi:peptidase M50B-like protein